MTAYSSENSAHLPLILASTSTFRHELLSRLGVPFACFAPNVDETPLMGEAVYDLVTRLSRLKAAAACETYPTALVIGSDQVAYCRGKVLGKPGHFAAAVEQLQWMSGQTVQFLTGLCVLNTATGRAETTVVEVEVEFRALTVAQIEAYLRKESALACAGSFRSEGLGIALTEAIRCDDPTALMGLPLITLVKLLDKMGFDILTVSA
jgi:septum formation protein